MACGVIKSKPRPRFLQEKRLAHLLDESAQWICPECRTPLQSYPSQQGPQNLGLVVEVGGVHGGRGI